METVVVPVACSKILPSLSISAASVYHKNTSTSEMYDESIQQTLAHTKQASRRQYSVQRTRERLDCPKKSLGHPASSHGEMDPPVPPSLALLHSPTNARRQPTHPRSSLPAPHSTNLLLLPLHLPLPESSFYSLLSLPLTSTTHSLTLFNSLPTPPHTLRRHRPPLVCLDRNTPHDC